MSYVKRGTHLLGVLIRTSTEKSDSKASVSSRSYRLAVTAAAVITLLSQASKCMERYVTAGGPDLKIKTYVSLNLNYSESL
jgi:hypothetical protein